MRFFESNSSSSLKLYFYLGFFFLLQRFHLIELLLSLFSFFKRSHTLTHTCLTKRTEKMKYLSNFPLIRRASHLFIITVFFFSFLFVPFVFDGLRLLNGHSSRSKFLSLQQWRTQKNGAELHKSLSRLVSSTTGSQVLLFSLALIDSRSVLLKISRSLWSKGEKAPF